MNECLFCKIVNGDLDSRKIYEDEKVIAILDVNPVVDGHTLIIPKKHYTDFKDLDNEILLHIKKVSEQLTDQLMEKLQATGIAHCVNYGDRQVIKHFHLHLLPDFEKKKASMDLDEVYKLLQ